MLPVNSKRTLRILAGAFAALVLVQYAGQKIARYQDRQRNAVFSDQPLSVPSPAALELHRQVFLADMHADTLLWRRDLANSNDFGQVDLPRLRAGHVGLQIFSAVTKTPWGLNFKANSADSDQITLLAVAAGWPVRSWYSLPERALFQARELNQWVADSNNHLRLIRTRGDLQALIRMRSRGKADLGVMLSLEGAHVLAGDADNLDVLFRAGYRMLGLAHFFDNKVAGSAHGEKQYGVTPFGRKIIERAQRLGMVIDLAHSSARTVDDVLSRSRLPVVFSHAGVTATCVQHGRNVTDNHLRRLRDNGGVIGIALFDGALCGKNLAAFFTAVDHAVEVAGVEHVGLGSDFDGSVITPIDASQWIQVTDGLLKRGYSTKDIRRLMGGNVVRVLMQTLPPEDTASGAASLALSGAHQPDRTGPRVQPAKQE